MNCMLFRNSLADSDELAIAKEHFEVFDSRCAIPANKQVICRYSCLPYYQELEHDLKLNGSSLINSYKQHRWITDFEYYEDLKDFTPESWDDSNFSKCRDPGPFIVKGRTNSRKFRWNSHMYAADKRAAANVAGELMNDMMIGEQGIIYRKFIPLKVLEYGMHGLPFSNEWRFFFYKTNPLSAGFYWSSAENIPEVITLPPEAWAFAQEVAIIAAQHANFFVLDIAEKEAGGWILIEVNDGQMSGLSENNPKLMYRNLAYFLE